MTKTECAECGITTTKTGSDLRKGLLHFCSHRCRAIHYNHTRRKLFPRPCRRTGCLNNVTSFDRKTAYCSQLCANLDRSSQYTDQRILEDIRLFVLQHSRIPTKRDATYLYRATRTHFGTWNKAIEAAGYEPNPVMFAKHCMANDGHRCDSLAEKIVDDWLYTRKIRHRVHVRYPWGNGMKCDFLVGKIWIEIFGLAGEHAQYDNLKKQKLRLIKKYRLRLIKLSLEDVYNGGMESRLASLGGRQHRPS